MGMVGRGEMWGSAVLYDFLDWCVLLHDWGKVSAFESATLFSQVGRERKRGGVR